MKKGMSLLLLCLIIILTACSQSGGGNGATSGTSGNGGSSNAGSNKPVTLRYGIWDENQAPAMKQIAAKFNETHPNITVNVEITPFDQYFQKLETSAAGNSMPDVFWMNPANFPKFASNDQLLPLSDYIASNNIDMNNYPKPLVDFFTYQDKVYGFPKDFDTIGLWYNKQLFDEAKVPYPDGTWDWNKLLDAAKKLTDPAKGVYGIGAAVDSGQTSYYNLILQNGGYVISDDRKSMGYDKPEAAQALQFWYDLIHKYKVSPTIAQMTDTTPESLFESGKLAMYTTGSWEAVAFNNTDLIKDKVDVAPLPQMVKKATIINGLGNVAAKNGKHTAEAWEFLKFLGSKEAAEIMGSTGTVIPAFNGTQDLWVKSMPNYKLQVFIDALSYAVNYPISMDFRSIQQTDTEQLTKAFSGQIPLPDALKAMTEKDNAMLAAEKG
ncbi:ABC transporter substrate-binding protein [Paenibacillus humicola]|uniref:ABC transporter substrate-binding protein n=1 Tax=Paenibacillus humicola TaxID=3110540 RepID=UPI00237C2630|nr:sugar ABC transporter substrate-binding protein [Paenibacillus humicola]